MGTECADSLDTIRDSHGSDDATLRLAIGETLHRAQLSDTDGQPYAEVTILPYEKVRGTLTLGHAPEGIDRGLVGIENVRLLLRVREREAGRLFRVI